MKACTSGRVIAPCAGPGRPLRKPATAFSGDEVSEAVAGDLCPLRAEGEASFAALCGVSPIDASSGLHQRHRLNRGGDRTADHALWRITLVRMSSCECTRTYVTRRTTEGRTKKEIIRSLKRYSIRTGSDTKQGPSTFTTVGMPCRGTS